MRVYLIIRICLGCCLASAVFAQTPASRNNIPSSVEEFENRISQIITKSEAHFRNGKLYLERNKRELARQEFDKAIDFILESGFDVRFNSRLQAFYLELVERIYLEEVPLRQPSNINPPSMLVAGNKAPPGTAEKQVGFREQKFNPSDSDALGRSVLKPQPPPAEARTTIEVLRAEFSLASKEYKASLAKLLALYERNVGRAEERFATSKKLFAEGLILESQLNDAANAVVEERRKADETRRQLLDADKHIGELLASPRKPVVAVSSAGKMPVQLANGHVPAVVRYLNDNLNDPYSMKLLTWSKFRLVYRYDLPFWYVTLRLRAKNVFGAYILKEAGFYLRNNKVVFTSDL